MSSQIKLFPKKSLRPPCMHPRRMWSFIFRRGAKTLIMWDAGKNPRIALQLSVWSYLEIGQSPNYSCIILLKVSENTKRYIHVARKFKIVRWRWCCSEKRSEVIGECPVHSFLRSSLLRCRYFIQKDARVDAQKSNVRLLLKLVTKNLLTFTNIFNYSTDKFYSNELKVENQISVTNE